MKEVVIKISDEDYKALSELSEKEKANELSYYERLIANGTPLPEGHGDLIDRSTLEKDADWSDRHDEYMAYSQEQIEWADAVIPADKEDVNASSS